MSSSKNTPVRQRVASAKLAKETHNSLVYSCYFGQSLYLSKTMFSGEVPKEIVITIEWTLPPTPNSNLTNLTPFKENTDGKTK